MDKIVGKNNVKLLSLDIQKAQHSEYKNKKREVVYFFSVRKYQTTQVEPENFHKPISKILDF